jgi:hypothetical protein
MATELELALWAQLDKLEDEKARMLESVEPLEAAKAREQKIEEAHRLKIKDLNSRIRERIFPRMAAVCADIRVIRQALNGKKRPEAK